MRAVGTQPTPAFLSSFPHSDLGMSEFCRLHTALQLPPMPILTRELVYTGITRAHEWLTLIEVKRGILNDAVTREVMRVSGMGRL